MSEKVKKDDSGTSNNVTTEEVFVLPKEISVQDYPRGFHNKGFDNDYYGDDRDIREGK